MRKILVILLTLAVSFSTAVTSFASDSPEDLSSKIDSKQELKKEISNMSKDGVFF